tara:strand:- start:999 stop:1325 length:327 start_codon:yes stop_codon:yes gene_type:complete
MRLFKTFLCAVLLLLFLGGGGPAFEPVREAMPNQNVEQNVLNKRNIIEKSPAKVKKPPAKKEDPKDADVVVVQSGDNTSLIVALIGAVATILASLIVAVLTIKYHKKA